MTAPVAPGSVNASPQDPRDSRDAHEQSAPLPGWIKSLYFLFPIVLYTPDALFNYYVYSDGVQVPRGDALAAIAQAGLWGFLAAGVVGMAYLLSVLAPWHWGRGRHVQSVICWIGVIIATGITIWNSLAYRSQAFHAFSTDQWAYQLWPQLQASHISVTMILVAVAPPFWGLFWAIVQPTETRRSQADLQASHAERLLRLQQQAEERALKAETAARVREAQLRGMAATASAAREQAAGVWRGRAGSAPTSSEPLAGGDVGPAPELPAPAQPDPLDAAESAPFAAPASPSTPRRRRVASARGARDDEHGDTSTGRIVRPDQWGDDDPAARVQHAALASAGRLAQPMTYRAGARPDMSHMVTPGDQLRERIGDPGRDDHGDTLIVRAPGGAGQGGGAL